MLLLPALALTACSVVPNAGPAPVAECCVRVHYALDANPTIDMPASSSELTILELVCTPAPTQERFVGGQRWLRFADGVREVVVRCRYRTYASTAREIFPGSHRIEVLP